MCSSLDAPNSSAELELPAPDGVGFWLASEDVEPVRLDDRSIGGVRALRLTIGPRVVRALVA